MSIQNIGLVSEYIKTKNFEMKWQERKANPLTPKGDEDSYFSTLRKQLEDNNKTVSLQRIESRLRSGDRLSQNEMEYLRKNWPEMYEEARKIEKERAEYRRALERCKTKEEAQALRMSRTQQYLTEANAISNNPAIPKDKKETLLTAIAMRAAAMDREFDDYANKKPEAPAELSGKSEAAKAEGLNKKMSLKI